MERLGPNWSHGMIWTKQQQQKCHMKMQKMAITLFLHSCFISPLELPRKAFNYYKAIKDGWEAPMERLGSDGMIWRKQQQNQSSLLYISIYDPRQAFLI